MSEQDKESGAKFIIDTLELEGLKLLRDQFGMCHAYLSSDANKLLNLDGTAIDSWVVDFMFTQKHYTISQMEWSTVKKIYKNRALNEKQTELFIRIGKYGNRILYDLGGRTYVDISVDGWSITDTNILLPTFKKFTHQKPQVVPTEGGSLDDFLKLINLPDLQQQLLLKVYMVTAFIPGFPHPVLMVHGPQGSAKTTMCALIKDLVDPSVLESTGIEDDKNTKELIQTASHHWLLCIDNLSHISEKVSDTISRICTGGGLSKRMLFHNDSDFIYNFQHIVVLNGISQVIRKPDLLDRTILIGLERIPDEQRATSVDIREKFKELKPKLLGAIFDTVSGAMREYPNINLKEMPRMADFAKWGCAVARALGISQDEFLEAYQSNVAIQEEEAVEGSPVAVAVIEYMKKNNYVKSTATELYKNLCSISDELRLTQSMGWPKDGPSLSRRLTELSPNLKSKGILFERGKDRDGRKVSLTKVSLDSETVEEITPSIVERVFNGDKDSKDGMDSNSLKQEKLLSE